jgi:opacity protein-like surface antigen
VINNLSVGVTAALDLDKSESEATPGQYAQSSKSRSITAGPFVRYYVPLNSKLYVFGQVSYGWRWTKTESNYTNPSLPTTAVDKTKTSSWGLGAGLSYFINPNIALEASLNYAHDRLKDGDADNGYMTTQKTGGFSLGIGFQIFLRKAQ